MHAFRIGIFQYLLCPIGSGLMHNTSCETRSKKLVVWVHRQSESRSYQSRDTIALSEAFDIIFVGRLEKR